MTNCDRPDWTQHKNLVRIWQEDDATPNTEGHITLEAAWAKRFGVKYDRMLARATWDGGDCTYLLFPASLVAIESYPGENAIYRFIG